MNKHEWDKLWAYIVGCFPSWKPNAASETSWLDELGDYKSADIISALREIGKNEKSSFFPPTVFKVVAELKNKKTVAKSFENNCGLCKGHVGIVQVKRAVSGKRWPETAAMRCSCASGTATRSSWDGDKRTWTQWGEGAKQRGWCLND